jgi:hypothetical protein
MIQVIPDTIIGMHHYTMRKTKSGSKRVATDDWKEVIPAAESGE